MSLETGAVRLDLNNPVFQRNLFNLPKEVQHQALTALKKLSRMTWNQVYRDPGIRWEAITSQVGPHGGRIYSLRLGKGFRALAFREGNWLGFLSLHPDHDSAYE